MFQNATLTHRKHGLLSVAAFAACNKTRKEPLASKLSIGSFLILLRVAHFNAHIS